MGLPSRIMVRNGWQSHLDHRRGGLYRPDRQISIVALLKMLGDELRKAMGDLRLERADENGLCGLVERHRMS